MLVKEVLEITINTLNSICIPVGLMQAIGEPIAASVGNLKACIEAIEKSNSKEGENDVHADAE